MLETKENYKIQEKEVNGELKYQVKLGEELKVFDNKLEANTAIKTFKMGQVFQEHTGMEIFIEKD